jgi:dTDP-4-dehydrorhamnose reductase
MKTIVIPANGQLGMDCVSRFREAGHDVIGLTHHDIELADEESVRAALSPRQAKLVINTAAMHNVEMCEQSPLQSFAVNGIGARNLARLANELNLTLVQISTDYEFDGLKGVPYMENDRTARSTRTQFKTCRRTVW